MACEGQSRQVQKESKFLFGFGVGTNTSLDPSITVSETTDEDYIKAKVKSYAEGKGWQVTSIAWALQSGPDLVATKDGRSWFIEAKGAGKKGVQFKYYLSSFLTGLGQLVTRMTSPDGKYSLAVPDIPAYRSMWERRVSQWLQETLNLTMIFVDGESVTELGGSRSIQDDPYSGAKLDPASVLNPQRLASDEQASGSVRDVLGSTIGGDDMEPDTNTLPHALTKAFEDSFHYALGLRNGTIIEFEEATITADDWIKLSNPKIMGSSYKATFERHMEVRVSEIAWIADAPQGS